jgi:hypothetical protein
VRWLRKSLLPSVDSDESQENVESVIAEKKENTASARSEQMTQLSASNPTEIRVFGVAEKSTVTASSAKLSAMSQYEREEEMRRLEVAIKEYAGHLTVSHTLDGDMSLLRQIVGALDTMCVGQHIWKARRNAGSHQSKPTSRISGAPPKVLTSSASSRPPNSYRESHKTTHHESIAAGKGLRLRNRAEILGSEHSKDVQKKDDATGVENESKGSAALSAGVILSFKSRNTAFGDIHSDVTEEVGSLPPPPLGVQIAELVSNPANIRIAGAYYS